MNIGLVGLGAMGRAMALNLVAAGHTVAAWNRSAIELSGVTLVDDPGELFQSDVVITMLPDDAVIRRVLINAGVLQKARPGLIHIVASTISVDFSQQLVALHQQADVVYIAAPVLGRPDVAAKGELNILAAGERAAIAAVRPVLDVLGKRVWMMGEKQPAANAAKIACNMMITMAIEAMAEAVVLTEHNGVEREQFFDLILNTLFGSRSYQVYSANIMQNSYEPGFKAVLGLKDLNLARQAAERTGRSLLMLDAVRQQMGNAVGAGLGNKDWSIMADYTIQGGDNNIR